MKNFLLFIFSSLLLLSCKPEKEKHAPAAGDLSGTYRLDYVGPDSRAIEGNLTEYCGGTYTVQILEKTGTYPEYEIFSGNSARLFRTSYTSVLVLDARQGNDTVVCYGIEEKSGYDPRIHSRADSLLIADPAIVNRWLFGHARHLLIQADRDRNDSTILFFKLSR